MSENARETLRDRLQHDDPRPDCTTASSQPTYSVPPEQGDDLHEECGIFGVYAPGDDVARLTFFGLFALQHRGQESAGIATARVGSGTLQVHRKMGLVSQAFEEADL